MSELIAGEGGKVSMPNLLNMVRSEIGYYFTAIKLKFAKRLTFAESRLQTLGSQGGDIVEFQERFNLFAKNYGISTPVTGVYDLTTVNSVAAFQQTAMYVLEGDGFVGPETARVLRIKLVRG